MGIRPALEQFERESLARCNLDYPGLKWCELGNQRFGRKPAKDTYLSYGVENHLSIDLNGKDGAMPLDLDHPVPFVFVDQFDVITNYGTGEHVNDQYHLFKNAHDMCKAGGIIIHIVPPEGHWPGHCRYYYTERFRDSLAEACGYEIMHRALLDQDYYQAPKNLLAFTYRKTLRDFITPKRFRRVEGLIDTGDTRHTGDYNRTLLRNKLRAIWAIIVEK